MHRELEKETIGYVFGRDANLAVRFIGEVVDLTGIAKFLTL